MRMNDEEFTLFQLSSQCHLILFLIDGRSEMSVEDWEKLGELCGKFQKIQEDFTNLHVIKN